MEPAATHLHAHGNSLSATAKFTGAFACSLHYHFTISKHLCSTAKTDATMKNTLPAAVKSGYIEPRRSCRLDRSIWWQKLDCSSPQPTPHTHTHIHTISHNNNSSSELMQISPINLCRLTLCLSLCIPGSPLSFTVFLSLSWMFDGAASCSLSLRAARVLAHKHKPCIVFTLSGFLKNNRSTHVFVWHRGEKYTLSWWGFC